MACREHFLLVCNAALVQLDGCQTLHLANITLSKKPVSIPKNLLPKILLSLLIFVLKGRKDTADNLSCVSKEKWYM